MGFFSKVGEGFELFKSSMIFIFKKPIFFIPIFFSWIVVAAVVLYNRYFFPVLNSLTAIILYLYFLIFIMALSICMSNIVMLELIQQIESGEKTSLPKAIKEAVGLDMIKVIPVALIWGIVWLIIFILKALTSKVRENKAEPSVEDAAKTMGGMNTPFSFFRLGLSMIEKLVRMIVFMALPAIAWENKGPFSAFKQSFQIVRRHPLQFLTSYSLTLFAGIVMALPLVPIYIMDKMDISISTGVWLGVLIYAGIVWTLEIYFEQMSVAMLYLWHLKWVQSGQVGELSSVSKPDLFDEINELKK